ncbi:hypothetical protein NDU88_006051 [Pleurodeles waltl]|uniref:Uncharacterized protein n=1 Tax=Pleurodeles waltl TaxID=8319 RepID=A0AAV7N1Y0_PLEWA|nr:hypothetical protein NDU88_006051 [Pleurodeles waltl]
MWSVALSRACEKINQALGSPPCAESCRGVETLQNVGEANLGRLGMITVWKQALATHTNQCVLHNPPNSSHACEVCCGRGVKWCESDRSARRLRTRSRSGRGLDRIPGVGAGGAATRGLLLALDGVQRVTGDSAAVMIHGFTKERRLAGRFAGGRTAARCGGPRVIGGSPSEVWRLQGLAPAL